MTTRLYLLSEVAEMTGLPARALADAARANKMPTHRIHGRRYMSEQQIEAYLASHVVEPVAGPTPVERLDVNDNTWDQFLAGRKRRRSSKPQERP